MKRLLAVLSLNLLLCPVAFGMEEAKDKKEKKPTALQHIKEYIKLKPCLLSIGALFADSDGESTSDEGSDAEDEDAKAAAQERDLARQAINILIDNIKFSNIKLTIKGKKQKASTFFYVKRHKEKTKSFALQKLLKEITNDYFDLKAAADNKRKLEYVKMFRNALKWDELEKSLDSKDYGDLKNMFDAAIAYYEGNDVRPVEDIVKLEKIFELIGIDIQKYGNLDKIKLFINFVLQKKPISKPLILDCFNIRTLIKLFDVEADEEAMQTYENAVSGIISIGIDLTKDQKKAMTKLGKMLASYDAEERLEIAKLAKDKKSDGNATGNN